LLAAAVYGRVPAVTARPYGRTGHGSRAPRTTWSLPRSVVDEPFGVSREGCHNGDLARKSQTVADRLTYAFSKQPNDVRWI
jgi:hypothetical protein